MSKNPSRTTRKTDRTAAVTLEVPSGVADDIEAVLRSFAEEAELDTSLVVDHSGFLIAGISSIPDVDVDTIGTLVAGASGATEGLTGALGEVGKIESLHLGEDRLLYLKDVGDRFILVGVSDSNIPAGILRDQATQVQEPLAKLLGKVKAVPMSLTKKKEEPKKEPEAKPEPPRSLRQPEPKPTEPVSQIAPKPNGNGNGSHKGTNGNGNGHPKPRVRKSGGILPRAIAAESPLEAKQSDPMSGSIFETPPQPAAPQTPPQVVQRPAQPQPPVSSPENNRVLPPAVVENSPFEMDDDSSENSSFEPVLPNTTPVHLSVPEARRRDAEAKKENEDDSDGNQGPRYSFELG